MADAPTTAVAEPAARTAGTGASTPALSPPAAGADRFRRREGQLEWRCAVCDQWNPLEAAACGVCGASFGRSLSAEEERPPLRAVSQSTALFVSAILPGAGHVLLGRTWGGVVRAATYLLWLVGGWVLVKAAVSAGQTVLPSVPLLLGALVLLVLSTYDAVMLAGGGQREVLTPRLFLWLVVVVVGALILSFVPSFARLTQR